MGDSLIPTHKVVSMNKLLLGLTLLLVGVAGYMLAKVQYTGIINDINVVQEGYEVNGYKNSIEPEPELGGVGDGIANEGEWYCEPPPTSTCRWKPKFKKFKGKAANSAELDETVESVLLIQAAKSEEKLTIEHKTVDSQMVTSVKLLKKTIQELEELKAELNDESS